MGADEVDFSAGGIGLEEAEEEIATTEEMVAADDYDADMSLSLNTVEVTSKNKSKKDKANRARKKGKSASQQPMTETSVVAADKSPAQKSAFQQGLEAYKDKDYANAATMLRIAGQESPNNLNAHFYAADAFMKIDQPTAAIYHLDRILSVPGNSLYEDAQWFKALCLLKTGQKDSAKTLLTQISAGKGKYVSKARKKLKDLEK